MCVQSWWRRHKAFLALMVRIELSMNRNLAAIGIQATTRGMLCRQALWRGIDAVISLQAMQRRRLAAGQVHAWIVLQFTAIHEQSETRRGAAVSLQTFFRADAAKMQYWAAKAAAIQLQTWVRGWAVRRQLALDDWAAVKVQTAWRGSNARGTLHEATKLELAELEDAAAQRLGAVLLLQRMQRGCTAKAEYWKQRQAAGVIQAHSRRMMGLHWRPKYAAQRIQATVRGRQLRVIMTEHTRDVAATVVQTTLRRRQAVIYFAALLQAESEELERENARRLKAATSLQAFVRADAQKKCYWAAKTVAIRLSALARGWSVRRKLLAARLQAECDALELEIAWETARRLKAATSLQAFARCDAQKMEFWAAKTAAIKLAALARGRSARRQLAAARLQEELEEASALAVQARWRGSSARGALRESTRLELAELEEAALQRSGAALVLQRMHRGNAVKAEYWSQRRAAAIVQVYVRRMLLLHWRPKHAAENIQAWARGWQTRTRLVEHQRVVAATVVQSSCRRRQAVAKFEVKMGADYVRRREETDRQHGAAVTMQAFWRKDTAQMQYWEAKTAAVRISALMRGHIARRQLVTVQQWAEIKQSSAVTMQARWRGTAVRTSLTSAVSAELMALEADELLRRESTVVLQSIWRGASARTQLAAEATVAASKAQDQKDLLRQVFLESAGEEMCAEEVAALEAEFAAAAVAEAAEIARLLPDFAEECRSEEEYMPAPSPRPRPDLAEECGEEQPMEGRPILEFAEECKEEEQLVHVQLLSSEDINKDASGNLVDATLLKSRAASPPPQPNGTGEAKAKAAGGLLCSECDNTKTREEYSKNQASKPAAKRRCKGCVAGVDAPAPAAEATEEQEQQKREELAFTRHVILVQAHWRGFVERTDFVTSHLAATFIQARYRGVHGRRAAAMHSEKCSETLERWAAAREVGWRVGQVMTMGRSAAAQGGAHEVRDAEEELDELLEDFPLLASAFEQVHTRCATAARLLITSNTATSAPLSVSRCSAAAAHACAAPHAETAETC